MPEISDYVPGPYQGVSQAPPQVRLPGTCDSMEDCIATIPNGVQKRPPFSWLNTLRKANGVDPIPADPFATWVEIPRGSPATDCVLLLNREAGVIQPYLFLATTMAPIAVTLDAPALAYLRTNSPVPRSQIRTCTVEDVTFITNRTVPVANGSATQAARPFEALIWVEVGHYAAIYSLTVTPMGHAPITATYRPSTGATGTDALGVGTDRIAEGLYDGTVPASSNAAVTGTPVGAALVALGYTVVWNGSTIYISHPTLDFTVAVSDDQGGTAMISIKGEVQRFSDLPQVGVDGMVVRIAQEAAGGFSDYYVQFSAGNATTLGIWKEVPAPGTNLGLDPTTMPIGLTDTAGVWELKVLPWTGRTTGDTTLVPDPAFIGDTITDLAWWRGRLTLVYTGGTSLSASDSPYKFYASTLAVALDSDAIELLPPADKKTLFEQALIFDQRLIVMGDQMQAIVQSTGAVTPSLTGMFPLSDSAFTDQLPAQGSNHKVYFGAARTTSMIIFEIAIDRLSGLALAEDLTPAVPTYLPSTLDRACTLKTDYITVYGSSGVNRMLVHVFRHAEQQRVQNAWYAWNLTTGWTLCGFYIEGTIIYAALIGPDGNFQVAALDLTPDRIDTGGTLLQYLDQRVPETACAPVTYSVPLNQTTFTLPIPVTSAIVVSCRTSGQANPEGFLPTIAGTTATTATLAGDWRGIPLWFGYTYASSFRPSKFYKLGQDGKPERTGRLTIRRVKADVGQFGYLRAVSTIKGRTPRTTVYEAYRTDDDTTPIDALDLQATAILSVPIGGSNEQSTLDFVNDSHLGFKFLGMEWQGSFTPKAQRVT